MSLVRFYSPRYTSNNELVDELFSNFFRNDHHDEDYVQNCRNKPATNVFEAQKEFKIEVLLPGFDREDVQMNVHKNILTIKVDKEKDENKNEEFKYAHREFDVYNFERKYQLPKSVNEEKISAGFDKGILTVTLPKKEEALEKAPVEIKVS